MRKGALLTVGIAGLFLLGSSGLVYWGWTLFTTQAQYALNENPVVERHLGEIERVELDLIATGEIERADEFVFRVYGSKATGLVTAEFVSISDEAEEIRSGTLKLESGEIYDLMVSDPGDGDRRAE